MLHARLLATSEAYRRKNIDWTNYSPLATPLISFDRPLVAQLAGDDPEVLVEAGRRLQDHVDAIDLNLGCPQNIAKRGHYGAYLLPERELVLKIVSAMTRQLTVPITVKIRKLEGPDSLTISLAQALEAHGCMALTIHGRTVKENKAYTGAADWAIIRAVKAATTIPIIANGGIESFDDVKRCLETTQADAVMSSEGLLENPRLFSGSPSDLPPWPSSQLAVAAHYLHIAETCQDGQELSGPSQNSIRSHLFKMLHRFFAGPANDELRGVLARADNPEILTIGKHVVNILQERLAIATARGGQETEEVAAAAAGLLGETHWYRRHRSPAQRERMATPRHLRRHSSTGNAIEGGGGDGGWSLCGESDEDRKARLRALKETLRLRLSTTSPTPSQPII